MEKRIKYVPFGLLVASLIKSLVLGTNLNEVLLVAILAGLTAFYEMKVNKKEIINLQAQIDNLSSQNQIQDKVIDDLKSSIVSVKVSSGVKSFGAR